ncbi:MAG: rhodanese-like domain-containing protein [Parachlamydiaceae bacterium]
MLRSLLMFLLMTAPVVAVQADQHDRTEIEANQLKSFYDKNEEMVILDARSKPYFDGTLLPHAKWVPFDSAESEIKALIPSKNSLVIVYCAGVGCPASGWLYDRLTAMGYKHVYEYGGGLSDWQARKLPTVNQQG